MRRVIIPCPPVDAPRREGHPQVFALLMAERAEQNRHDAVVAERAEQPLRQATRIVSHAAEIAEKVVAAEGDGQIDATELLELLTALDRLQGLLAPLKRTLHARRAAAQRGGK